ncbi:MAG: GH25 family lysozyme [Bellilinea sp.]|jgi:hypothetical protein
MKGIFISGWTTDADLSASIKLFRPEVVFYRVGLYVGQQFRFDDLDRLHHIQSKLIPVYIVQERAFDDLLIALMKALHVGSNKVIGIDVELDMPRLVQRVSRLVNRVRDEVGAIPLLYTNRDFITRYRMHRVPDLTRCPLWLASYTEIMPTVKWDGGVAVWQRAARLRYHADLTLNACDEVILDPSLIGIDR